MQLYMRPSNHQETAPKNHRPTTPTEETMDEQDTPTTTQGGSSANAAVVEGNIATDEATQKNRAMGSATMVLRNQASGKGTKQENSATNCVLM